LPEGAIVEIKSLGFDRNKLVEVIWDGKNVMMFNQDIQCRAERVRQA